MLSLWSLRSRRPATARRTPKRPSRQLNLEVLEDRLAPAAHIGASTYATIQAAVNAATPGAVITVDSGTYAEKVTVNKSVTIEGAQVGVAGQSASRTGTPATESVVTGASGSTSFYITASNVTIDGFTVEDATDANNFGFGILIAGGVSGTHIQNNIIQDNIVGIGLANGSGGQSVIENNLIRDNNQPGAASGTGIYSDQYVAGGALQNVLINNNAFVSNNNAGLGLSSTDPNQGASDIIVSNNTFDSNGRQIYLYSTTNSTITGNTITNATTPTDGGTSVAIGLYGNDANLAITNNVLQNGNANGIRIGNFNTAPNSNITINNNSISGYTNAALLLDPNGYVGTLNANGNFWGAATGPTDAMNPGGNGGIVNDPANQVQFAPWLSSGVNGVPNGHSGFSGDPASLIFNNPVPPPSGGPGANGNLLASLQQQILRDVILAQALQNDLDGAAEMLLNSFIMASRQSPANAAALVFDEFALTVGGVTALEEALLGIPNDALLDQLADLDSAISDNPITPTLSGQQIIALTGALVVTELF